MPDLDWTRFRALPGATWRNWELLCYGLIRRNYGAYGTLVAIRAQPVVEFHLTLTKDCSALGSADEQWGWQCKFWDEEHPKLNSSRKQVIKKAFTNQPKYLPNLDHLVFWTHHKLSQADWNWIQGEAPVGLAVHSWTEEDVSNLLVGDAEPLLRTYFGAAVLSPKQLESAYAETKRTLRGLVPEIHVPVRAERSLQTLRGRARDWPQISEHAENLSRNADQVEQLVQRPAEEIELVVEALAEAKEVAEVGRAVTTHLDEGLVFKAVEAARSLRPPTEDELSGAADEQLGDELRRAVSDLRAATVRANHEIRRFATQLRWPLIAIDGPVGAGKTQLTARLGAPMESSPAGVIVAARSFGADIDLDKLATFGGLPAMPIDELLEALDAAGARAGERLPLVIDGLHESPKAPAWRDALVRLSNRANRLNNVYVVVTLRPSYRDDCIPDDAVGARLPGLGSSWRLACRRYFQHYKIRADIRTLPEERFANPLFLRIFCEATNPDGRDWVELGVVPSSLVAVLETYVQRAIGRLRDRLRVDPAALQARMRNLASFFWEGDSYALYVSKVKEILGDDDLVLDNSLTYALEDEGLLDRDLLEDGQEAMSPSFDALGGYLIADALLPNGLARDAALAAIDGRLDGAGAHPLAEDIRQALGHLFVTRAHCALHQDTSDPDLRRSATLDLLTADPTAVTRADSEALRDLIAHGEPLREKWIIVIRNHALPGHPFNAEWLDSTLGAMSVGQRDLDWTEALRFASEDLLFEVETLTTRWRVALETNDQLHLRWLAWLLTSTDRQLRDRATEAIYWFGRQNPGELHRLALEMLDLNDPYVPERLMAACYGVAMANQFAGPDWIKAISPFLGGLDERLLTSSISPNGAHWLLREYAIGIRRLVCELHPDLAHGRRALTQAEVPVPAGPVAELSEDDERHEEISKTLHMDFHNYTVGRLFEDRGNYNFDHPGHKQAVAEVLARVWNLGWRESEFLQIDRAIAEFSGSRLDLDPAKVNRYGKKYGWIGFYEAAGRRAHAGLLQTERLSDVDIDPSFPLSPPPPDLALRSWIKSRHATDENWVKHGKLDVPNELLVAAALDGLDGPWICLYGFLYEEDATSPRRPFMFIWGALVKAGFWEKVAASLGSESVGRHTMPEPAGDYYTFAGEIPWAPAFAEGLRLDRLPDAPTEEVVTHSGAVELVGIAHDYAWESYHSVTNADVAGIVPSRAISNALGLRGLPQTFDLATDNGAIASRSFTAPHGFEGRLLYMRSDLLQRYLKDTRTEMGWLAWGERELRFTSHRDVPGWYSQIVAPGKNEQRRVVSLKELLGS